MEQSKSALPLVLTTDTQILRQNVQAVRQGIRIGPLVRPLELLDAEEAFGLVARVHHLIRHILSSVPRELAHLHLDHVEQYF